MSDWVIESVSVCVCVHGCVCVCVCVVGRDARRESSVRVFELHVCVRFVRARVWVWV